MPQIEMLPKYPDERSMRNRLLVFSVFSLIIFFMNVPVTQAQEAGQRKSLFFISPIAEAVYSRTSPAFGGGFTFGAEDGITLGLRAAYFVDSEDVYSLEADIFVRVFFFYFRSNAVSGPFIQVNYGAVIFARNEGFSPPADAGTYSAFLLAGWRFLLGNRFFIEPAIRGGTPYFIGAGVSAGFKL